MFYVTNSTWTLLAIVPSSNVCECGLSLFSMRSYHVRMYLPTNSTSHVLSVCVDGLCCIPISLCPSMKLKFSSHCTTQSSSVTEHTIFFYTNADTNAFIVTCFSEWDLFDL